MVSDTSSGFKEISNKLTSWLPNLLWLKNLFFFMVPAKQTLELVQAVEASQQVNQQLLETLQKDLHKMQGTEGSVVGP